MIVQLYAQLERLKVKKKLHKAFYIKKSFDTTTSGGVSE